MKKILIAILAFSVFIGCSDNKEQTQSNTDEKAVKSYKVGTAANYPPFEFVEDTIITGFDIDLMKNVAKKIGVNFEFINMSFDGLIPAIKGGKVDIIASAMSATDDRRKSIDFSDSYYHTENLFLKQKVNEEIKTKDDLSGKKIGVQLGTVQEMAAKEIKDAQVVPAEDMVSAIMYLKSGKVDAVLTDSSIGYGYLKKNEDLIEFFSEPDGSEGFSIAFDKGKYPELIKQINKAIEELKQDGTFDEILKKYDLK